MNDKVEKFEQLKKKHQKLAERKVKVDVEMASCSRQLEQAKAEARELFKTDNLDALRKELVDILADNEKKTKAWEENLNEVEAQLTAAEKELGLST